MMKEIGNYVEFCENQVGVKSTPIKIEKIEDVFSGEDLKKCLNYMETCTPHNCHYNSGMAYASSVSWLKDWTLSFCEGLAGSMFVQHCWNCFTNKTTGEKHYVDFTLNEECDALLFMEWDQKDICDLFCACKYAFIPFRDWQFNVKTKKAQKMFCKYYPNLADRFPKKDEFKNGMLNIVTKSA